MISALVGAFALAVQAAEPPLPAAPPASAPSATAPTKAPKAKSPSQKVVCRDEATVGSLIPKRICLTQEDWDAMREAGKEVTSGIQTGALQRASRDQALSH